MKICFENSTQSSYDEFYHQTRKIQETAESVVPDTNDDIGRIASVQSALFLKSKDVTGRGVLICGELVASLLYITENEKQVSHVRLSRQFSLEYDIGDMDADALSHINLAICNTEARVLNPRKVSVTFEISGELSCYRKTLVPTDSILPATAGELIHTKQEKPELLFTNAVCERPFTLSEQYIFPAGKPAPNRIISQKAVFCVNDSQLIGTKLIVKGSMELNVLYLSDEVSYPVSTVFSGPFSQIIDIGEEEMESCAVTVELTALYGDIVSTINGDKALDCEVHALMQLACRSKKEISYVADAYSNRMPSACTMSTGSCLVISAPQQIKMIADERLSVTDDCADVLCVCTNLSQLSLQQDKAGAAVTLDVIYRGANGGLNSVRRLINVSAECSKGAERILAARIADVYIRPDGTELDVHLAVELKYICARQQELTRLESVELDEEKSYDLSAFPAVSLVRVEQEELWELAKTYHSSVEQIMALNAVEDGWEGKLLLIPKSS